MKKNLQLLISPAFIILVYFVSQVIHGAESSYSYQDIRISQPSAKLELARISVGADGDCTLKGRNINNIAPQTHKRKSSDAGTTQNAALDSKRQKLTSPVNAIPIIIPNTHERDYQRFLNAALVYKPWPHSDNNHHRIFPIAALKNPLDESLALSIGCDWEYMRISTGYRPGISGNRIEIWLMPRFLAEINGNFKELFPDKWPETAFLGIFWTWGWQQDMRWYKHLTTKTLDELCKGNIAEVWDTRPIGQRGDTMSWHKIKHWSLSIEN